LLRVSAAELATALEAMTDYRAVLSTETERLKRTAAALKALSGLEGPAAELTRAVSRTEEEALGFGYLIQALDTACRCYRVCENRLLDCCEEAGVTQPFYIADFIELGGIAQSLSDII
jgi:hypothetical protein